MAQMEQIELDHHRGELVGDVNKLVEKYRKIFSWDIPEIDQVLADKLILTEIHQTLDRIENKLLG